MSSNECDRLAILENENKYNCSRMGSKCKKLSAMEEKQNEILRTIIKTKYLFYGVAFYVVIEQLGIANALKIVL
jgi:hypothetical protein